MKEVFYNSDGVIYRADDGFVYYDIFFDVITGITAYTTSTDVKLPIGTNLQVLVVGGGGSGASGGGGSGGVIFTGYTTTTLITTITVGDGGGDRQGGFAEGRGEDSIFGTLTAIGGGCGGYRNGFRINPGLGGGAWDHEYNLGGAGVTGQFFNGGYCSGSTFGGAGGGGAGGVGKDARGIADSILWNNFYNGDGGPGLYYGDEYGDEYGENGYFGGGGGGYWTNIGAAGGPAGGIGGGGKYWGTLVDDSRGQPNTGGGGASTIPEGPSGAGGGSGIVIIKPI